jgi:hypothetical protein
METTPKTDEIYGECLLQKILVLDSLMPPSETTRVEMGKFLAWFPTLKIGGPNYARLKEAVDIIRKMELQNRG